MEEKLIDSREAEGIKVELYHKYSGNKGGYEVLVHITSQPTRFWYGYRGKEERIRSEALAREDFKNFSKP